MRGLCVWFPRLPSEPESVAGFRERVAVLRHEDRYLSEVHLSAGGCAVAGVKYPAYPIQTPPGANGLQRLRSAVKHSPTS